MRRAFPNSDRSPSLASSSNQQVRCSKSSKEEEDFETVDFLIDPVSLRSSCNSTTIQKDDVQMFFNWIRSDDLYNYNND